MNNKLHKIKWSFKVKRKILKKYQMIISTLRNSKIIYRKNSKIQAQKI